MVLHRFVHQELYLRSRRGMVYANLIRPSFAFVFKSRPVTSCFFRGGLVCLVLFYILYFLGIQVSFVILLGYQGRFVKKKFSYWDFHVPFYWDVFLTESYLRFPMIVMSYFHPAFYLRRSVMYRVLPNWDISIFPHGSKDFGWRLSFLSIFSACWAGGSVS